MKASKILQHTIILFCRMATLSKYINSQSEIQHTNIGDLINRLLESEGKNISFTSLQLKQIATAAKVLFAEQPSLLQLEAPVKIVGDIHGQFFDLVNIFKMSGYPGDVNYVFLGDYVDRGPKSLECIMLLFCYKLKYPQNVFLLRGNHEIASVNRLFGFYEQCKNKIGTKYWKIFNEAFNVMPLIAIIEKKILCVHAGLSPQLDTVDQIAKIIKPLDITNQGIPIDLLWSDPEPNASGWQQNQRGISYTYGQDIVHTFLKENNLDLIVRSHQVVEMGYEFLFNRQLVTIFSAPDYMGQYGNYGAIMVVDEDLKCSFELIKPKGANKKVKDVLSVSKK